MTPLSEAQIRELQELEKKATRGPWASRSLIVSAAATASGEKETRVNVVTPEQPEVWDKTSPKVICHTAMTRGKYEIERDNADLIAALHNSAPALLQLALDGLKAGKYREALEQIRDDAEKHSGWWARKTAHAALSNQEASK